MHHRSSKSKIWRSSSKRSRCWGQLLLHPGFDSKCTHINLSEKTFTVGRFSDCSLSINEHNVGKAILKHISRRHFVIKKQMVFGILVVRVTDTSFNGTFVNGVKIGRNNTFTLFDGDSLAIGKPNFTLFTFKDLCSGKSDHKNIENKLSLNMLSHAASGMDVSAEPLLYPEKPTDENNNSDYLKVNQYR